jgi:glycine cleavage system H protein
VVEVNEALNDEPGLVNESPYEDGWMVVLELKDPSEVEDLLSPKEYAGILAEIVMEEKGERVSLNLPEEETEEVIEESLETLPEEEIGYEEKER